MISHHNVPVYPDLFAVVSDDTADDDGERYDEEGNDDGNNEAKCCHGNTSVLLTDGCRCTLSLCKLMPV